MGQLFAKQQEHQPQYYVMQLAFQPDPNPYAAYLNQHKSEPFPQDLEAAKASDIYGRPTNMPPIGNYKPLRPW